MTLPAGIETITVTFGTDVDITGGGVSATMVATPSHDLVWAATGQRILSFDATVTVAPGVAGSIALPAVDQSGFQDGSGNAYTMWAYTLVCTYRSTATAGRVPETKVVTKTYQPLSGQGTIDFDQIPDGTITSPVQAPQTVVTSFNTRTGAVTLTASDIPDLSRTGARAVGQGELIFNVMDYGAKGDGATDDTVAIQDAINAAAAVFGAVLVPSSADHFVFSTLTVPQGVTLRGNGYECIANAGFGYAGYVNGTDRPRGSVLRSTATSGSAITFTSSTGYGPFFLRDLAVVGPGSGTSTGVTLGESASAVNVRNYLCNALVCNFDTCWDLIGCEDSTFDTLRAIGCGTGLTTSNNFNQNVLRNIEAQYTTIDGVVLSGTANVLHGVLAQNCSGNSAVQVAASSPGNTIISPYLENNTATDGLQLNSATTVQGGNIVSNGGKTHVATGANGCYLEHIYAPGVTLLIDAGVTFTTICRADYGTFTRNGADLIDVGSRTGGVRGPVVSIGNDGAWQFERTDGETTLRLKDVTNDHYIADFYPGATDTAATVVFHGVLGSGYSTTANRPNAGNFFPGGGWFDTTLGKPIWSNGTAWVDATGTAV